MVLTKTSISPLINWYIIFSNSRSFVALKLPSSLYNMLPYIISLVVLVFVSKKSRAPKAEGIPYDKGQR